MKTSVVIIAHNEEKYIAKCIESILNQTQKPDEVILVIHNSSDKTLEIVNKYPITTIPLTGEPGPVYARIEGIKNTTKEIILCIDGDSIAEKNWIEVIVKTLEKDNILVGTYIKFKGTLFDSISNVLNNYFCVTKNTKAASWIWGGSFAFFAKDKDFVLDVFNKSINPSKELNLPAGRIAEDYWLALFMNKKGKIEVTNKTYTTANIKEGSNLKSIARNRLNHKTGKMIRKFFDKNINLH